MEHDKEDDGFRFSSLPPHLQAEVHNMMVVGNDYTASYIMYVIGKEEEQSRNLIYAH